MATAQLRCRYCGRWFRPDPRLGKRQVSCGSPSCRRAHTRGKVALWRRRHPEYVQAARPTIQAWAFNYPDYWKHRRKTRPEYARRDNARRRASHLKAKSAANVTAIADSFVEKLLTVRKIGAENAANVTAILRRTEGLVDALIWKERAAKRNSIDPNWPVAG